MTHSITKSRQSGLSLIELMVAITLSMILMIGAIQIFLASKSTYVSNQSLAELQENGRFALAIMSRSIPGAGYSGRCNSGMLTDWLLDSPIEGWSNSAPSELGISGNTSGIFVEWVNVTDPGAPACDDNPSILTRTGHAYYLENNSLMLKEFNNGTGEASLELITGVDTINFRYGIGDLSKEDEEYGESTDNWVLPEAVTESLAIKAVELSLTISSGTISNPLSEDFSTVIALRNRLP